MISRHLEPQSPRWFLVTQYIVVDWNHIMPTRSPYSRKHMYRPVWSLQIHIWIIQEGWEKVLWSDETKIELFGINSTRHVRKKNWLGPQEHHPNHYALRLFLNKGDRMTIPGQGKDGWGQVQRNLEWKFPCLSQDTEDGLWMDVPAWYCPKVYS